MNEVAAMIEQILDERKLPRPIDPEPEISAEVRKEALVSLGMLGLAVIILSMLVEALCF